jgi:hypothetical protein
MAALSRRQSGIHHFSRRTGGDSLTLQTDNIPEELRSLPQWVGRRGKIPLNPATGTPYFVLNKLGWGTGWAADNVLRFNTAAANYPIWLARTVLQGPASALSDSFQVQIRGDIDR